MGVRSAQATSWKSIITSDYCDFKLNAILDLDRLEASWHLVHIDDLFSSRALVWPFDDDDISHEACSVHSSGSIDHCMSQISVHSYAMLKTACSRLDGRDSPGLMYDDFRQGLFPPSHRLIDLIELVSDDVCACSRSSGDGPALNQAHRASIRATGLTCKS